MLFQNKAKLPKLHHNLKHQLRLLQELQMLQLHLSQHLLNRLHLQLLQPHHQQQLQLPDHPLQHLKHHLRLHLQQQHHKQEAQIITK